MKSSVPQTSFFRPKLRKIGLVLGLASLLGGLSISPALAERNNGHDRGYRQGDHQREWRRDHDHRHEWRGDRHVYRHPHTYRQPHYYAQPVYVPVPPPVYYYEPPRPPGVSLYFPLDFSR